MLSWRFWHLLQHPPLAHPAYQRAINSGLRIPSNAFGLRVLGSAVAILILVLLIIRLQANVILLLLFSPILLVFLATISPALLPFVILGYGTWLAVEISHAVYREKQAATFDLLWLSAAGPVKSSWAIASGVLHRGQAFGLLQLAVRVVLIVAGIAQGGLALTLFWILSQAGADESALAALHTLLELFLLTLLFYTGYFQSIVLSVLTGQHMPQIASGESIHFGAAAGYLALQFGSYILPLLIGYGLLPILYDDLHLHGWLAAFSLLLLRFALVVSIREMLIVWLWERLLYILNSEGEMVF